MKSKKVLVIIILMASLATWYIFTDMRQKKMLDTTQSATKQATTVKTIAPEQSTGIVYKNTKYGFEFSFDAGYKDLWSVSEKTDSTGSALENALLFTLKNTPNPDIFVINIYTQDWWTKNAEVDETKSAWIQGQEKSLGTALGKYLGANTSFVFTLFPNDQTCPDLGVSGPGPLCKLTEGKTEMVMNSFKIRGQLSINDKIKNWKVYRDTEQGFEFKYPEECRTSSDPMAGGVQIISLAGKPNDICNFSVTYGYYDNLESAGENIKPFDKIYFQNYEAITGIFKNEIIALEEQQLYTSRKNTVFLISYFIKAKDENKDRIYETTVSKDIIRSFKFTK